MIKRLMAEFIGTFVIVFAPVALAAVGTFPGAETGLMAAALVSGLAVAAMVSAVGPISAAHLNPAVTLGFAVSRRFPWRHVAPYWFAQLSGAVLAAGIVALMFGAGNGVHHLVDNNWIRGVGTEAVITFLLMLVIMAVATDRRVRGSIAPLAIGLTVVIGVLIAGPITGGSMNPARAFGPAVFGGSTALSEVWLYFVGPAVGAVMAAMTYEAIRSEPAHAKSAPELQLESSDLPIPQSTPSH